jgi:hypothetical protein
MAAPSPLAEQITRLIDAEVEKRVSGALSKFAERVSLSHKIPLPLLLRDLPTTIETVDTMACMGVTDKGARCTRKGKMDGFCKIHFHQKKDNQPVQIVQSVGLQHNHGVPPFYKHDCPACSASRSQQSKPLIDFNLFKSNE